MKVGLLSPHYAFNYGAVLQAFALKTYLRDAGVDAVIINRRPKYQCAIPSVVGRMSRRLEEFSKRNSFGAFEREHLQPQTPRVVFDSDWLNIDIDSFDAMIVGSDQVWRDDYTFNSFGYNLFFDFVNSPRVKKISYAPSLGKTSWRAPEDKEARVKELLHRFDAISVREDTSIQLLKSKFGVDAKLVLDPTMLLTATDYRNKLKLKSGSEKAYIASYILDYDDNYHKIMDKVARELKVAVRGINIKAAKSKLGVFIDRFSPMARVTDWVENIANADYVVTNSFHGMVFSIIFRKQFVVFMNSERGAARFHSLLNMFGLNDRLVAVGDNSFCDILSTPIDYNLVDTRMKHWQGISYDYLKNALNI